MSKKQQNAIFEVCQIFSAVAVTLILCCLQIMFIVGLIKGLLR
jgi:hypothetical protein